MKIQGPTCPKCGRAQSNDQLCQDCSRWNKRRDFAEILVMNRSVYAYNDFMKDILARFKFRGDTALADLFKKMYSQRLNVLFQSKNRSLSQFL